MIEPLKPYPVMKDSGVTWLGEVPEHWEVLPNRVLFDEIKERYCTDEQMLSVTIKKGVIPQTDLLADSSKKDTSNLDRSNYKLLQPGDIAYNKMRAWQGAIGVSDYRGIVSPAYVIQRPRKTLLPRYFHHLFRTPSFAKEAERWSYGITSDMWSLRPEHFKLIYSCLPPLPEQTAIVRYLDYVDRRIRRLVRAKRKLIALLTEQKQAIIHRAVTRGLNPDVPLKDSGVEWLGKVPEHWEVRRLKTLVDRIDQGISPQADNYLADDGSWGVLKSGCVNHGIFKEIEHKRLPKSFKFDHSLSVKKGDVLVSRACGSPDLVGSAGRVVSINYQLILSDKIFRTAFKSYVAPDFMVLAMNSRYYRHQVQRAISGADGLANNLPLSALRAFVFLLPPIDEQQVIIQQLARSIQTLDEESVSTSREIDLLHEYRTRLIADVVTGKLDVREAAARLPEDTDATEPPDLAEDIVNGGDMAEEDLDEVEEELEA